MVSSLWRVSDLATALLMIYFYQLRFNPDALLTTAQALQRAQNWLENSSLIDFKHWLEKNDHLSEDI